MSLCVSDSIDRFNTYLTQKGYATIGPTALTQQESGTAFTDMLDTLQASGTQTEERQAFYSRPLLGCAQDGLPVVGASEEAYAPTSRRWRKKPWPEARTRTASISFSAAFRSLTKRQGRLWAIRCAPRFP